MLKTKPVTQPAKISSCHYHLPRKYFHVIITFNDDHLSRNFTIRSMKSRRNSVRRALAQQKVPLPLARAGSTGLGRARAARSSSMQPMRSSRVPAQCMQLQRYGPLIPDAAQPCSRIDCQKSAAHQCLTGPVNGQPTSNSLLGGRHAHPDPVWR